VQSRRRWGAILALAVAGCGHGRPALPLPMPSPSPAAPSVALTTASSRPPVLPATSAATSPARELPVASPARVVPVPLPTRVSPVASPARPGPSCGVGRAAGTVVLALPGGRRALFAVPPGDDGHHRLGLVIALPGYGQTSEELAAQSRIPARAMAAGVFAVLPQGAGPAKSWNFSGTTGYDDEAFLSALITRLTGTECADPARVVITGLSDGGDMAGLAACALPGRFRAVVTVAASTQPRPGCHPIRIVAIHGDADPLDPYRGGPDGRPGYPPTPPAVSAIAAWAALDGCPTAAIRRIAPHVVTTTYACGVQLVTVNAGGHAWPGGAPVRASLGVTTGEYDATATILGLL
jgi:polyhydroxybutyrate depolymerase